MRNLIAVLAAALVAIPFTGCHKVELQSRSKDREIVVDGDASDWKGLLDYVEDAGFSWGLMNDQSHLYIAIASSDREVQRQIMHSGLYLWFDEGGKESKNFGVHFPVGMRESSAEIETPAGPPRGRPDSLMTEFFENTRDIMLYSPVNEEWRMTTVGSTGDADAVAGYEKNALVLEYKVPLGRLGEAGYGIGAPTGGVIGVGLESPEVKAPRTRQDGPPGDGSGPGRGESPGGEPGEGPPGMGGGNRPRGDGFPPGAGDRPGMEGPPGTGGPGSKPPGGPSLPKAIKIWARVGLSK
jgi:hypothetical protein